MKTQQEDAPLDKYATGEAHRSHCAEKSMAKAEPVSPLKTPAAARGCRAAPGPSHLDPASRVSTAEVMTLTQGLKMFDCNEYERAFGVFDHLVQAAPTDSAALLGRACCYSRLGKKNEQLRDLDALIRSNPKHYQAFFNRSLANLNRDNDRALADINTCLAIKPNFDRAIAIQVLILCELKLYRTALESCTRAIEVCPAAIHYSRRGHIYADMKEYGSALADYDTALAAAPGCLDAHLGRGMVLSRVQSYAAARAHFDTIIEIAERCYPHQDDIMMKVSKHYAELASATKRNEHTPTFAQFDLTYKERALCYEKTLDFDIAIEDATKSLFYNSIDTEALALRSRCHQAMQRYDDALVDLKHIVAWEPENLAILGDMKTCERSRYEARLNRIKAPTVVLKLPSYADQSELAGHARPSTRAARQPQPAV